MIDRKSLSLFLVLALAGSSLLQANSILDSLVGRKAEGVEKKKVEKKLWSRPEAPALQDKKFPIKEWNKHFSSLGSKRAPITTGDEYKKKRYEVEILERKTVDFEMSEWNKRMADLHKRAGIKMGEEARLVADRKLYNMMLQDSPHYMELAEELSMRDLNRFQFRRNRSDEGISVKKAGSGDE